MPVYDKDSKLSDPIFYDPSVIPVLNRFGIDLGVGDHTIADVCKDLRLNQDFFLAVINTYLNSDYIPEHISGDMHVEMILDYLEKTDRYYLSIQLPNIERHFNLLLSKKCESPESIKNLDILNSFFHEVKAEMSAMIGNDLEYWFPMIRTNLYEARSKISNISMLNASSEISLPFDNHVLEDKIDDLVSFFVVHLRGNYDKNLLVAVVSAIFTLAKDVRQNNRIRDRILQPICTELQ